MKKVVFLKKQKSLESKKSDFVKQAERSRFVGATKAKDLLSLLGAGVAPALIYYKYVFVGGGVCVCAPAFIYYKHGFPGAYGWSLHDTGCPTFLGPTQQECSF